ncbi:MAG: type II secretion system protein [Fimbriimonas sp.]
MRLKGFGTKEILLAILVIGVAGAVIFGVARSLQGKELVRGDVGNMQKVYLSLALYETESDGWLPADLLMARDRMPEDAVYLSNADPFANAEGPFPVDPGLPSWRVDSPIRVSYSYLYAFVQAGKTQAKPWYELKYDPKVGLLADEWQGKVTAGEGFQATVSGTLLRLNTDGALMTRQRGSKPIGDVQELFFAR